MLYLKSAEAVLRAVACQASFRLSKLAILARSCSPPVRILSSAAARTDPAARTEPAFTLPAGSASKIAVLIPFAGCRLPSCYALVRPTALKQSSFETSSLVISSSILVHRNSRSLLAHLLRTSSSLLVVERQPGLRTSALSRPSPPCTDLRPTAPDPLLSSPDLIKPFSSRGFPSLPSHLVADRLSKHTYNLV